MSERMLAKQEILNLLHSLSAWTAQGDFSDQDWEKYVEIAKLVQSTDPDVVAAALDEFTQQAIREGYQGYESESKPFILMRVVFEIPETGSAEKRFSFKGWSNWPEPDANNEVNLSWPISWIGGSPTLVAPYEGSMGRPYAAAAEYRFLLKNFPYRKL